MDFGPQYDGHSPAVLILKGFFNRMTKQPQGWLAMPLINLPIQSSKYFVNFWDQAPSNHSPYNQPKCYGLLPRALFRRLLFCSPHLLHRLWELMQFCGQLQQQNPLALPRRHDTCTWNEFCMWSEISVLQAYFLCLWSSPVEVVCRFLMRSYRLATTGIQEQEILRTSFLTQLSSNVCLFFVELWHFTILLIVSMLQSILWVIYRTRVGSASMKAVCLQGQDAWISGWAVGLMLAFLWKSTTLPLSPALRALKILLACFKQQKHELRCVDNPVVCYHVLSVSVSTWGRAQWLSFFKQHNFLWYRQQHGQKDSMIPIFLEQALEEWSAWFDNVDKSEHTCCDVQ